MFWQWSNECLLTLLYPALCENFSTRILIEDELTYYSELDLQNPTYYIDDELAVGRIELCWQEIWNPICEDFFTIADASVTCHQLGFSRAGTTYYS